MKAGNLADVSIGIKTFLRDDLLTNCITNIIDRLPECKMIIADDGDTDGMKLRWYEGLNNSGHSCLILPFDSGFGKKSNDIVSVLNTPYLLVASDDFDFSSIKVRQDIQRMLYILNEYPDIDIVSGRVNNRPYEFDLKDEGEKVTEIYTSIPTDATSGWYPCDLTVNYSLIRRKVFHKVRWDDDVKIGGGEHGAFFVDVKRAGFKVGYAGGVNINEQYNRRSSTRYMEYRNRARSPERPCFDKRGIKEYILANGQVDYKCER